jgi:AAHS family 4-hydroxybenzoate transporter-like MFS transporter
MNPATAVDRSTPVDPRQFIDQQPFGAHQFLVASLCAVIVFVDGFDAQAMGYVAPALSADLHVPRALLGTVISSGLVGMMVGALVFGPLADRVGRKPVLVLSALTFGVGSILTATASSVESLSVLRLLTGLGMGGAMPNAIALTSEYMPDRVRPTGVTTMFCGFSLGAAVGGLIAASLIPRFGWQSVFVVGGITPIVVALVATIWLPESIRFLLLRGGRDEQVRASLARIAPHAEIPRVLAPGPEERRSADFFEQLFAHRRGAVTLLIWVVYFMTLLNVYFMNSWLPTIITDAGIPLATANRITSLFQIGGIVGALVLGAIVARQRSFGVLALAFVWAAAAIVATGLAGASIPLLVITVFCSGIGVIGGQTIAHALSSEFYPTAVRSTGVGWALGVGRIGSIVGPTVGGLLLARGGGTRHVFWAAAVPATIAAIAAWFIAGRLNAVRTTSVRSGRL